MKKYLQNEVTISKTSNSTSFRLKTKKGAGQRHITRHIQPALNGCPKSLFVDNNLSVF